MIQAGSASSASPCRQPALSGSRRSVSLITSCQDDAKPCRAKFFALTIGGLLGVGPTAACNAAPWELNRSCKNLSALAVLAALLSTVKPQTHACPRDAHGAIGIGKAETGDCDSRIPIEAVELRIREVDVVGKPRISVGLSRIRFVARQGTVLIDQPSDRAQSKPFGACASRERLKAGPRTCERRLLPSKRPMPVPKRR